MTTMTHSQTNGRRRPSLSEQINRLDSILDGLSEGLNEAVADAVADAVKTSLSTTVAAAVKEAVQAVVAEVVTNPEIQARLQLQPMRDPAPAMPTTHEPQRRRSGGWDRLRTGFNWLLTACHGPMQRIGAFTATVWKRTSEKIAVGRAYLALFAPIKYHLLAALGSGTFVAVAVWYAGPWLAALFGGISGFFISLILQASLWLRGMLALQSDDSR